MNPETTSRLRRPQRQRFHLAPRLGAFAIAALVVALPLARGGVAPWASPFAVALALAAFVLPSANSARVPICAIGLATVTTLQAIQLVPVPPAVHRIAPGAVRLFETSLGPLGLYPAARPLSLSPADSGRELLLAITCLGALVGAWATAETKRRRRMVLSALALAGSLLVAAVLASALVGQGSLIAPRFPFVNRNHLAAALNLSAFVALALALRSLGPERGLWLIAFAASGALSFLTVSRGGILAFLLGAMCFVALYARTRQDPGRRRGRVALIAGILVAVTGLAAYAALDPLLARVASVRSGAAEFRTLLWRPALQVLLDFPVLGIGRGAFPDVFAGYQLVSADYLFTHVENEWLQALIDLGVGPGLLLVGTFASTWIVAARRRTLEVSEVGLLAGTGAVAAQNLVDFSLGVAGVAVPFAVGMGLLARGQRTVPLSPTAGRALAAALALVGAGGFLLDVWHDRDADQRRLLEAGSAGEAVDAARAAIAWRPADWLPHATAGARLASEDRCDLAMPWLLRAMSLDPTAPAPHLLAARCLVGRDDGAARREYRLATMLGLDALREAAARYPRLEHLLELTPDTPDGLLALGSVLESRRESDAAAASVYRRVLDQFSEERAVLPLARIVSRLGEHQQALDLARRHSARSRTDPLGYEAAAAALVALGRDDDAESELQRGLLAIPGSPELLGRLAERKLRAHRWAEARRLADQIAPRSAADVAQKDLLVASSLTGQGRLSEAAQRIEAALAAQPGRVEVWMGLAALRERLGRFDDAIAAVRRAAALPGGRPDKFAPRIAALEAARDAERARATVQNAAPPNAR